VSEAIGCKRCSAAHYGPRTSKVDDLANLAEFSLMWSDLMDLEITPVIEDRELSELFKRMAK
jgi:hypothetical protein